ncbi:MAG: P-loop containing nucleoside triphosphate hydrolase protein [Piptocephalis tieghemiana]|nr:MAG: P-loop containing nucleoside triphosphate hydrolase protein [Piptocephalis tieghemiana]
MSSKLTTLGSQLETKVLRRVRQYLEENPDTPVQHLSPLPLINYVQQDRRQGLQRIKRVQIESALVKVLRALREEEGEEEESRKQGTGAQGTTDTSKEDDDEDELMDEGVPLMVVKDTNAMNKAITSTWAAHHATSSSTTSTTPSSPATASSSVMEKEDTIDKSATVADESTGRRERRRRGRSALDQAALEDKEAKRRRRQEAKDRARAPPTARLSDLGGVDGCIEEVLELIAMPISHPEIYLHTGVSPPRGILLHGPPGCGKTLLANAIAGELGVPFIQISAPSVVSGMSGESEKKIRDIFEEAREAAPCLLFIDEIDAITPKRETAAREMERRIVAQLLTSMDDLAWEKTGGKPVMIIGATNRPDALDSALRRAGRFDREIGMGVPDEEARGKILRVLSAKLRLSGDFDFSALAKRTAGYVGADLNALTSAAGMLAVKRIFHHLTTLPPSISPGSEGKGEEEEEGVEEEEEEEEEEGGEKQDPEVVSPLQDTPKEIMAPAPTLPIPFDPSASASEQLQSISAFLARHPEPLTEEELEPLAITNEDFLGALTRVQPSSKREGFATVPDVTWADIGALESVRNELRMAIVEPIRHPEFFSRVGITAPAGVLLWGPPGCGKTLLAKAVANESRTNFISVKGPELLNKYVGESERAVRQVFTRARASSPCVVFFDELDALCARRDDSQSEASARVVNTLLTELDGVDARKQVFVIAATNRPDIIDSAMLRPGRLDKLLYVELPSADERVEILRKQVRRSPLAPDVDLVQVAKACEGFSGADLASLAREAAVSALRKTLFFQEDMNSTESKEGKLEEKVLVDAAAFAEAMRKTPPSVSAHDRASYEELRKQFSGKR